MEFVWVPAGAFVMGPTSVEADADEQPLRRVRISRAFWLGKYEMPQAEWQAVMGSDPSLFDECGLNCPVDNVSWEHAQAVFRKLNIAVGYEQHRLPTEAEWEYAARAGTDPRGPTSGSERVSRGGSWGYPVGSSRAPSREGLKPEYEGAGRGFRLLRMQ